MKKMFYKTAKIFLLPFILFFIFAQTALCDIEHESILISNLKDAKTERQQKKANLKLLEYYMLTKDYESAVVIGNNLLQFKLSNKQKYNVLYSLANSYLCLSKPEKALEIGREAQFLYPKKIETVLLLGYIYKDNGLNELAIGKFKECLELDYNNFEALINLGEIYNSQENYKLSLEYFEKAQKEALNNKDLSFDNYVDMAISAKEIGKIEQAKNILENLKDRNKKASLLLVEIYRSKKEFDKAINELLPFVYKEANDLEVYCNLAQMYLLSDKFEEAKDLLLFFKSKNKKNNEVIDILLVEAYHNIYHNKARELKELQKIYRYTNLDYIKRIVGKVIEFEKAK